MTPSITDPSILPVDTTRRGPSSPGEVGAFRHDLLSELARQMWPQSSPAATPDSPLKPEVQKKQGARQPESEQAFVGSGVALDPTTAAAAILNSPASQGASELEKPSAQPKTPDEKRQPEERSTSRREENPRREPREIQRDTGSSGPAKPGDPSSAQPADGNSRAVQPANNGSQPERAAVGGSIAPAGNAGQPSGQALASAEQVGSITGAGRAGPQAAPAANTSSPNRGVMAPGGAAKNAVNLLKGLDRPSSAPRLARGQEETVGAQLVRGLASILRQRGGAVTIRLNPEALGAVKVKLEIDQSAVRARFEASNDEARRLLSESSETLRHALEARGLSVEKLEIVNADSRTVDGATSPQHHSGFGATGEGSGRSDNPAHGTGDRGHGRPGVHSPQDAGDEASGLVGTGGMHRPTIELVESGGWLRLDALA